jgi:hypothetical protein
VALETTSLEQLDRFFEKYFRESDCFETLYRVLSTELRDSPKQETGVFRPIEGISFPEGVKKRIKFLILTSVWYYPENPMSFYLLLECKKFFGKEFEAEYSVLSSSKILALGFWLSQEKWSDRDFYGNVTRLTSSIKFLISHLINVRREPTFKVKKYTGYCRGYSESGRWAPWRSRRVDPDKFLTEREWLQKELLRYLKAHCLLKRIRERLERENICV